MDFTSFSHGQIISKQWLIDSIEDYLFENIKILILGGWYNVLGFMLLTKYHNKIGHITNIDIDSNAIMIADKLHDAYLFTNKVTNVLNDSSKVMDYEYDMVINCSPEHMAHDDWFTNIQDNKLVIIQSSDMIDTSHPWYCVNPNPTFVDFINHYRLKQTYYTDEIDFNYSTYSYKRFMLIGRK